MPYTDVEKRRAAVRAHYRANKQVYKDRANAHRATQRKLLRALILGYLAKHPCIDCGEADPVVLEFDHRNPKKKRFTVCYAVRQAYSVETVRRKISRCDVRCCNCHRRRTTQQFGWLTRIAA